MFPQCSTGKADVIGTPNILIVGVNWLGDACMSMPAIQVFRDLHPVARITVLTKPPLIPLWDMQPAINEVRMLDSGPWGLLKTAARLRKANLDTAYIFPNSWRSALVAFLAGIPRRIGAGPRIRFFLLTKPVVLPDEAKTQHQQWEYAHILGLDPKAKLPKAALSISPEAGILPPSDKADTITIGMIPGAARGRSKQWPVSHFIQTGRLLLKSFPECRFAIFGTAEEATACNHIADAIKSKAISLAGKTTLPALAATLAQCATVICNDSGGMHLAAASGTPVVAVYGRTDPGKTGPLGPAHLCIRADTDGNARDIDRDIDRDDVNAIRALSSIAPERVAAAVIRQLKQHPGPTRHVSQS